jgi:hypothetical protein
VTATATVDIGGWLSAPTNSKRSKGAEELPFPSKGTCSCLNKSLAADLSVLFGSLF